jgi:hypothetical protein
MMDLASKGFAAAETWSTLCTPEQIYAQDAIAGMLVWVTPEARKAQLDARAASYIRRLTV